MKKILLQLLLACSVLAVSAQVRIGESQTDGSFALVDDGAATVVVSKADGLTVRKIADLWAGDVKTVTGRLPMVTVTEKPRGQNIVVMGTASGNALIRRMAEQGKLDLQALDGGWEQYIIKVVEQPAPGIDNALVVVGSDRRGVAYGAFSLSEAMGVSPWAWWADVPVGHQERLFVEADVTSKRPSVQYRGFFINDEDWGLKPWASTNYERKLGDIGPRTYARVCELILRLKGNMVAPAMHTCTGAFYSHKESKLVADTFGIIITTSHCEPLLINNAAPSEWDNDRDGEWNYKTNAATIRKKWENRLKEASRFENIYTVAMRGLHDEGLRGSLPMAERVPLIEQVVKDQREMLVRHKRQQAEDIPQIFVPYKETMDIYENGLRVPDDITLVWVDDNYGYMKRVSTPEEQQRSGRAGVYYHLSYLGTPHDYLWLQTTPPVLMYEELKKAYDTGADRYWLLNVGDIKPMELGIQTFFDMAWNIGDFDLQRVNRHQAAFMAKIFGQRYQHDLQSLLDEYYRLAWSRKPEYMGWEWEWSDPEHTGLKDTQFSFANYNEAQRRLASYEALSDKVGRISRSLPEEQRASFFELIGFAVKGACQMNRKFLMAQLNHELVKKQQYAEANWAARQCDAAYDSIQALCNTYNTMLDGKWQGLMDVPPGFCALYQEKPEVVYTEGRGERAADLACRQEKERLEGCFVVNLADYQVENAGGHRFSLVSGLGYDWQVVQLGEPLEKPENARHADGPAITYQLPAIDADSVAVHVYTIPFFPLYQGRHTDIGVAIDHQQPQLYRNEFTEWSQEWKEQVMMNGDVQVFRFAINRERPSHTLKFIVGDPGMMIQKIVVDWGGLRDCYIPPTPAGAYPTRLLDHEAEVSAIVGSMTLEEKVAMLHGKNMFSSAGIERLGIADMEYADGPFGIREEMEPHSWNSIHLKTDSATFFPTGSALAATWSTEWAYAYGRAMSREARLRGKDMILGPAINIQRIPTGGRTYEYLSEDPLLSGALAVAYTRGSQDDGTAVCLKHYALNNQEDHRGYVDVNISNRAMHEIYLRPFEMAVREADAWGLMAAYNKVNGRWCSENEHLLTTVLRRQWGFPGMVISDWGGVHSTVDAVTSGMNVEMPGERFMGKPLLDSVRAGIVSEEVIDERVKEILRVRMTVKPIPRSEANSRPVGNDEEMQVALEVARRSVVLLKNDQLLPINPKKVHRIAVIGENAVTTMALGGVGAGVKTRREITPLEGLRAALGNKVKISYAQGYKSYGRGSRGQRQSPVGDADPKLLDEAVALAKQADLILFFAGNNREVETEGSDRKTITLPSGQDQLAEALAKTGKRMVTVIVAGGPVDVSTVDGLSGALLVSWFNGSMGGQALAEVLTGKISPSGKLPMSWPRKLDDVPAYALGTYPQRMENNPQGDIFVGLQNNRSNDWRQQLVAEYAEEGLVGYRWYDRKNVGVAYPFGYGLSYAQFQYADLELKPAGEDIDVTFTLTNSSDMAAEEVAQVYVARPDSKLERPVKELKGFKRVLLKGGDRQRVTVTLRRSDLCHWDEPSQHWALEPGRIVVSVGGSSSSLPLKAEIILS